MRVHELRRQGWTLAEIAAETGFDPATISKQLKADGPPTKRRAPDEALVMNARWRQRVAELIETYPRLLGVSVHNKLRAEGFAGGYSTVTRELREIRGARFKAAAQVSVPIHTDPGEEAQFDFCDLSDWAARWGWPMRLWCFGMILCWSRWRLWWFTTSEDRQHTFEGIVRFFEAAGGIPAACRTDRMGALGRSQGRRFVLHPPTVGFAAHHATTITSCRARDAKRKGKVERPFRQLQETFLPEVELDGVPADLADLNRRAEQWLAERVHGIASRSTGEAPAARLALERGFLSPLPRTRFDSDYVESRRVHNIVPFITVDGVRYSMPADTLGQLVEIRRQVDAGEFSVAWAGRTVATHTLGSRGDTVWDPEHHAAAQAIALGHHRDREERHLTLVASTTGSPVVSRLELGDGDYDVEVPDLDARYSIGGGELA
ncbi:MAG: IS21 family transposase [Ilumatobacteraceae bacterium]